jgi:hypothetical protein
MEQESTPDLPHHHRSAEADDDAGLALVLVVVSAKEYVLVLGRLECICVHGRLSRPRAGRLWVAAGMMCGRQALAASHARLKIRRSGVSSRSAGLVSKKASPTTG